MVPDPGIIPQTGVYTFPLVKPNITPLKKGFLADLSMPVLSLDAYHD
jgi:hypothetical protein